MARHLTSLVWMVVGISFAICSIAAQHHDGDGMHGGASMEIDASFPPSKADNVNELSTDQICSMVQNGSAVGVQTQPFTCDNPILSDGNIYLVSQGNYSCSSPIIVSDNTTLIFQDASIILTMPSMIAENYGAIFIGHEPCPITNNSIQLELYGAGPTDECVFTNFSAEYYQGMAMPCPNCINLPQSCWGDQQNGAYGSKVIAVGAYGILEIHGYKGVPPLPTNLTSRGVMMAPETRADQVGSWRSNNVAWAVLTETLWGYNVSNNSVIVQPSTQQCLLLDQDVLASSKPWAAGDRIVIGTTDFEPLRSETATLIDCSESMPDCASTLCVSNIQWNHYGGRFTTMGSSRLSGKSHEVGRHVSARVGLLTRNIVIRSLGNTAGDPFPDANAAVSSFQQKSYGFHTMVRYGATTFHMEGVHMIHPGQGGLLGRYAVHFHMLANFGAGTYAHGNSIEESMTRGVTMHRTRHAVVSSNVVFKSMGHMFYLEDSAEAFNAFVDNLGVLALAATISPGNASAYPYINPRGIPPIIYSDCHSPTGFWITNLHNVFRDNQIVGATGGGSGYWFLGGNDARMTIAQGSDFPYWNGALSPLLEFKSNHVSSIASCYLAGEPAKTVSGLNIQSWWTGSFSNGNIECPTNTDAISQANPYYMPSGVDPLSSNPTVSQATNPTPFINGTPSAAATAGGDFTMPSIIEEPSCVRAHASQEVGSAWLRAFPWFIMGDGVFADSLSRGPTLISGGAPVTSSGLGFHGFFMGFASVGRTMAPINGSQAGCMNKCGGWFDIYEGIKWPSSEVDAFASLINVYDGPFHAFDIIFENATQGVRKLSCDQTFNDQMGEPPAGLSVCGNEPNNSWWNLSPNTAVSWMMPNAQYYPVAFTMEKAVFFDVDLMHFAFPQYSEFVGETLRNPGIQFTSVGVSNYMTILQDLDGSLTGTTSTRDPTPFSGVSSTVSLTSTRFFQGYSWEIECLTKRTCLNSPFKYINFHVVVAAFPPVLGSVQLYRLSMTDQEISDNVSVSGFPFGQWSGPAGIIWGMIQANTTYGLAYEQPDGAPEYNYFNPSTKSMVMFISSSDSGDMLKLQVSVGTQAQQVTVEYGIVDASTPAYNFYPDPNIPSVTINADAGPTVEGMSLSNGILYMVAQQPYDRGARECWEKSFCVQAGNGSCVYNRNATELGGQFISEDYFEYLDYACEIGRVFTESLDQDDVAHITQNIPTWQRNGGWEALFAVRLTITQGTYSTVPIDRNTFQIVRMEEEIPGISLQVVPDADPKCRADIGYAYQGESGPDPPANSSYVAGEFGFCPNKWDEMQGIDSEGYVMNWQEFVCNREHIPALHCRGGRCTEEFSPEPSETPPPNYTEPALSGSPSAAATETASGTPPPNYTEPAPSASPSATATETASGTPQVDSSDPCFPAHAWVKLRDGSRKRMDELDIGDSVMVGVNQYSEIYFFGHKLHGGDFDFVHLQLKNGKHIELSQGHMLWANGKWVYARDIGLGDLVWDVEDNQEQRVQAVSSVKRNGLFNPHTLQGDIVVNGIQASSYTNVLAPKLAHLLLWPERLVYQWRHGSLLGTSFDKATPAFLATMYALFSF